MADKEKVEDVMHVEEGADGTATVDLPDGIEFAQGGDVDEPRQQADDGDQDHPDDSEAVRAARRARRRSTTSTISIHRRVPKMPSSPGTCCASPAPYRCDS